MNKNIVLIGFMGSGKSVVSKRLSSRLKRKVVSTDESVVRMEQKSIPEIFSDSGEDHFRQCEKKVIADIAREENVIIDCGGGVVLDPENLAKLKEKGTLFYLAANPEILYQRVKKQSHRPLLNCDNPKEKIEELLTKREPCYKQADHIIDTNGKSVAQVCKEIVAKMTQK